MEAMALGGIGLVGGLIVMAIGIAIQAVFVFFSAKWIGADKRTFGACFLAVLVSAIINFVMSIVGAFILPGLLSLLLLPIMLFVTGFIFSKMLVTSLGKGVLIALLSWVLAFIVLFVLSLVFGAIFGLGAMALGGAA
ncbi:hypothetical protein [Hydrogenophaga sp. 5NK40-0174]|uniref:hypothetical protein n=1 Tax=Hydrogenophaga sp. 5NK40-0174 TaxID=3127649 RepID=UPI00310563DC